MRKITEAMRYAFTRRENMKRDNTEVVNRNGEVSVYLWNNKIAWTKNGSLWITNCGWSTNTTKERLNGLPGVSISQKRGSWYLNGEEWDGEPICVQTGERLNREEESSNHLGLVAGIAMLGNIFCNDQKESNDWKARMLKAGLGEGLQMPDDWGSLSEEEKQRRLDGAIEILK